MPLLDNAPPTNGYTGGLMGDPGAIMGALGMALLSGPRNAPLQNLPAMVQMMNAQRLSADKMAYQKQRDQVDDKFRERQIAGQESDRARKADQWKQSFGLQQEELGLKRAAADAKAPTTHNVKQSDGSEVSLQWNGGG